MLWLSYDNSLRVFLRIIAVVTSYILCLRVDNIVKNIENRGQMLASKILYVIDITNKKRIEKYFVKGTLGNK